MQPQIIHLAFSEHTLKVTEMVILTSINFRCGSKQKTGLDSPGQAQHVQGTNRACLYGLNGIVHVMWRWSRTGKVINLIHYEKEKQLLNTTNVLNQCKLVFLYWNVLVPSLMYVPSRNVCCIFYINSSPKIMICSIYKVHWKNRTITVDTTLYSVGIRNQHRRDISCVWNIFR